MSAPIRASVQIFAIFAAASMALAQEPPAGAPFVYVTTDGGGSILRVSTDDGSAECVYGAALRDQIPADVEDIVIGPDGLLYACDPTQGTIIRLDPVGQVGEGCLCGPEDVQLVFTSDTVQPRSPWFTHRGDLLFTDASGGGEEQSAVRRCTGAALEHFEAGDKAVCSSAESLDNLSFAGEGLTQAANGDLLVVAEAGEEDGDGAVWRLPMDQLTGEFTAAREHIIHGLQRPVGIARVSSGEIFVADVVPAIPEIEDSLGEGIDQLGPSQGVLYTFPPGGGDVADATVCATFGAARPYYLEAAADDTLYVATGGEGGGQLWSVTYDRAAGTCQANPVIPTQVGAYVPALTGVAVPFTATTAKKMSPDDFPLGIPIDSQLFNFFDMLYEFRSPYYPDCQVDVAAAEARPEDIQGVIDAQFEEEFPADSVKPVTFFGDNGRVQVFDISPAEEASCPAGVEGGDVLYQHALNAYYAVHNPKYVLCHGQESLSDCNFVDFSSVLLGGFFPDDGRIGGFDPRFSRGFLVDAPTLADLGLSGGGTFCGLEAPVRNVDDPTGPVPRFKVGSTIPLKFHVAEVEPRGNSNCRKGPFVTYAVVVLGAARVDPDTLHLLELVHPQTSGHYEDEPAAIFTQPSGHKAPYHFNWNTKGLEPGLYQLTFTADTDNFPFQVRYVELVGR